MMVLTQFLVCTESIDLALTHYNDPVGKVHEINCMSYEYARFSANHALKDLGKDFLSHVSV